MVHLEILTGTVATSLLQQIDIFRQCGISMLLFNCLSDILCILVISLGLMAFVAWVCLFMLCLLVSSVIDSASAPFNRTPSEFENDVENGGSGDGAADENTTLLPSSTSNSVGRHAKKKGRKPRRNSKGNQTR